jgi:hypothetical protein
LRGTPSRSGMGRGVRPRATGARSARTVAASPTPGFSRAAVTRRPRPGSSAIRCYTGDLPRSTGGNRSPTTVVRRGEESQDEKGNRRVVRVAGRRHESPETWQHPYFNDEVGEAIGAAMAPPAGGRVRRPSWARPHDKGERDGMRPDLRRVDGRLATTSARKA